MSAKCVVEPVCYGVDEGGQAGLFPGQDSTRRTYPDGLDGFHNLARVKSPRHDELEVLDSEALQEERNESRVFQEDSASLLPEIERFAYQTVGLDHR